uniref:Uncharacterized protein n=1 Tax=Oryza nivara TaxID=4536 RepID=A0A0E0H0U8_ORYNI
MVDVTPTAFFHQTHHHHPILTGDDNDELPPPFPFLPPSPSFTTPHLAGDDDNRNDASARYVSTSFLSAPSIATTATTAASSSLSSSLPVLLLPTSSAPASSSPLRAPPATVTAALKGLPERRLVLPPLGGVLLHLLPGALRCSLAARNFHELFHVLLLFLNPPSPPRPRHAPRPVTTPWRRQRAYAVANPFLSRSAGSICGDHRHRRLPSVTLKGEKEKEEVPRSWSVTLLPPVVTHLCQRAPPPTATTCLCQ